MRKFYILLSLLVCISCSQNTRFRKYVIEAMREEVLFETHGYIYTPINLTVLRTVSGKFKISKTNFFFQSDNSSIKKEDTTDFIIPIKEIKNIVILDEMNNEQITFRFNLRETKTMILSSEKTQECIDLIKSLQNQ